MEHYATHDEQLAAAAEELVLADTADKPRILLMGPRRSGKTSIERVVFHKMSPHETLFLESTHGYVGSNACAVREGKDCVYVNLVGLRG